MSKSKGKVLFLVCHTPFTSITRRRPIFSVGVSISLADARESITEDEMSRYFEKISIKKAFSTPEIQSFQNLIGEITSNVDPKNVNKLEALVKDLSLKISYLRQI